MPTRTLTGITPSGTLHVGNYFGAMRPAIAGVAIVTLKTNTESTVSRAQRGKRSFGRIVLANRPTVPA